MTCFRVLTLLLAFALGPQLAFAGDVFLKMLAPQSEDKVIVSDLQTLVNEGYLSKAQAAQSQQLVTTLLAKTKEIFASAQKQNLHLGGRSSSYYLERIDQIEIMLDTVQMQDGFGVLANKTGQISSTAFFNKNADGRLFIVLPMWPARFHPIVSTIIPEANRATVTLGTFIHEVISVLGGDDRDYAASSAALWNFSIETRDKVEVPLRLAGGGSVVGGAGSDIAFLTKLLLQGLHDSLLSLRPQPPLRAILLPVYESLAKEIETLSKAQHEKLSKMILQIKIEELGCERGHQSDYEVHRGTDSGKTAGYLVRLCSPSNLGKQLKENPEVFDSISLRIFKDIISDVKNGSKP